MINSRVKWKKKESKKEIKKEEPVGCLTRVISTIGIEQRYVSLTAMKGWNDRLELSSTNTGHLKVSNLALLKLNHSPKFNLTIVMFKLS
jgi:hypothetical protein